MSTAPAGTELARSFLPAKDSGLSKRFYEALGFDKLLDSADVAIFRMGRGSFLLQANYQQEWAENFMMQLMVDDLDAWWSHIQALELPARFVWGRSAQGSGIAAVGAADRLCHGPIRSVVARGAAAAGCAS